MWAERSYSFGTSDLSAKLRQHTANSSIDQPPQMQTVIVDVDVLLFGWINGVGIAIS
jgi:hypothetical protein